MRNAFWLLALAVCSGCAVSRTGEPPEGINTPPAGDLQLVEALADIKSHFGTEVRWGGTVRDVTLTQGTRSLEVIERNLDEEGKPRSAGLSDGRFVARVEQDAASTIRVGDLVTVVGTLQDVIAGAIGKRSVEFPVVTSETVFAWPNDWAQGSPNHVHPGLGWNPWYPYPYYGYGRHRRHWRHGHFH